MTFRQFICSLTAETLHILEYVYRVPLVPRVFFRSEAAIVSGEAEIKILAREDLNRSFATKKKPSGTQGSGRVQTTPNNISFGLLRFHVFSINLQAFYHKCPSLIGSNVGVGFSSLCFCVLEEELHASFERLLDLY